MAANPPPQLTIDSSALDRPPKRRRTTVPPPPVYDDAAAVLPEHLVADLLNRSTATIMKTVGFDGATLHAQERMRQLAEDYLLQMLHTIQLFSRAGRRTRPTVFDFQDMLAAQHLPLSTLEPELHRLPPTPPPPSLHPRAPSPPPPPPPDLTALLGPALAAAPRDDHLPPYPSRHTYLSTPVYTSRPVSPRQIRERATEEARLAENALRKLLAVGAGVGGGVVDEGVVVGGRRWERDEAWRRAWEGVKAGGEAGGGEGGGGVEGGVVNAERRFWRKGKRGRRG
ncbi:transcription factor TFIID complex subunit 8 C-term-domain-containing protein [Morchella snyderi]|nr:transcription factor TFIID complex subunit 8 C-term-domain-containing protein [Morchella snyderi]